MSSQLWKLLIAIDKKDSLTCSECFALLELLAAAAHLGSDITRVERLARAHLAKCPDCREQIWVQLEKLEELAR